MSNRDELLALAECVVAAGALPEHLRRIEQGLLNREIRAFQLVPETRALRDYCASVDAALMLVPEGWGGATHFSECRKHHTVKLGRSHPTNKNTFAEAATPALALVAASLRACAAMQGEGR